MRLMYPTARRELLDVEMPDGVRLATSVSLPQPGFRGPVVLLRSPYPFLSFAEGTLGLELAEVLASGFAVVRQDVRGRGGSGGRFGFLAQEGADGRATVAWIAGQRWCDGRVATIGGSYLGRAQLLMGDADPSPMAMIPALTGLSSEAAWWPNGVLNLALLAGWLSQLAEPEPRELAPHESAAVRALLAAGDPLAVMRAALQDGHPANRLLESIVPLVRHERRPDMDGHVPRIPSLHVTGWYDQAAATTLDVWQRARERSPDAAHPLIVGPWSHEDFGGRLQGLLHPGGDADAWGLAVQQLDFLRHAVLGEGDAPPAAQVYVTGADAWRTLDAWPPPTQPLTLWLDAEGARLTAAPAAAGGALTLTLTSRAAAPVPSVGGPSSGWASSIGVEHRVGPADVRELAARDDVLALRSTPLDASVEVAGAIELRLTVAADLAPAALAVKLAESAPDGTLRVVTDGVGTTGSQPAVEPAALTIALSPVHHRLRAGCELVVLLAGSEFPRYPIGLDADRTLRIPTGGEQPARLVLPVVMA